MPRVSKLSTCVTSLARHYPGVVAPPPRTPFEWVLWENAAYLVADDRRAECFAALTERVGARAEDVAGAPRSTLLAIAKRGGMHPETRVQKLLDCADIALRHGGGDLVQVLALPPAKARRVLREFPGIGAPGAERILMECGASTALALDSNGLRVLLRLGYGRDTGDYARDYRSVQADIERELVSDARWASRAHELLRIHGKTLCVRTLPDCDRCPLTERCALLRGDDG